MNIVKPAVLLLAATALVAGGTATATAAKPGGTRVTSLRQTTDQILAGHPEPLKVTADQVRYDGLTVTAAPRGGAALKDLACDYGHLCMVVRGTKFDFYKCQTWNVTNWTGDGPFTNNQTPGTVARFFNQDGSVRWASTAYEAGTATWDPIWSLRPC